MSEISFSVCMQKKFMFQQLHRSILRESPCFVSVQELGEDAPLHIGGLRLHCDGDNVYEIAGSRRKQESTAAQDAG